MKVLIAICIIGFGLLVGCGSGPTAPKELSAPAVTPAPSPSPAPCRPAHKCIE